MDGKIYVPESADALQRVLGALETMENYAAAVMDEITAAREEVEELRYQQEQAAYQ